MSSDYERAVRRLENIVIQPHETGGVETLLQDKSKDLYVPTKEDLEKLYRYQDMQNTISEKDPFAVDTTTGSTMVLTLNRTKVLNVLNTWLFVNLNARFKHYRESPELKLMIIKGQQPLPGQKPATVAYCAGGDIKELAGQTRAMGPIFPIYFFTKEYNLDYTAATVNKPRVAFWDGIAMGGGLGISIHSEFRIVTERTKWAMPEVGIGLFPDVGASYFLPRLDKDGIANYIGLTGKILSGVDCLFFGIATHMVKSSDLPLLEQRLINMMIENGSLERDKLMKLIDETISEYSFVDPKATTPLIENWPLLARCFSNQHKSLEQIMTALKEENHPITNQLHQLIRTKSPTSLKVTFKQIKYGKNLSLEDCFRMEYRLAIRSLSNNEFIEGVRAQVVDKDQKPKWNPSSLEATPDDYIDHYFSKLPNDIIIGDDSQLMPPHHPLSQLKSK